MGTQIETARAISELGVLTVIAGVAIVGVVAVAAFIGKTLAKFLTELIKEFKGLNKNMQDQNKNMAISLEVIKNQTGEIVTGMKAHDEKADSILLKVIEINTRVEKCPGGECDAE